MTKNSEHSEHTIRVGDGWTVPNENGVGRRTLVAGAAWTIPVVATAVGAPLAAASEVQPSLAFTRSSYSGTGCGVISGVQVRRTTDGSAPAAGEAITVTLSDGYTFAGGSTTYSATSGADGTITLPDITVPAGGGDSAFSATSGTLTAAAPVSSTATDTGYALYGGGNGALLTRVPNTLGVLDVSLSEEPDADGDKLVADIVASDGTRWYWDRDTGVWTQRSGGPAAEHVATTSNIGGGGAHNVFSAGSSIYGGGGGGLLATTPNGLAVTDISLAENRSGQLLVDVQTSDGARWRWNRDTNTWTRITGGPASEHLSSQTDLGGNDPHYAFSNGSRLYSGGNGAVLASVPSGRPVADFSLSEEQAGTVIADVVTTDGARWRWNGGTGAWTRQTGGPAAEHVSTEYNVGGGDSHYVFTAPAPCA